MFKGYISSTIKQIHWIIHNQRSFLISHLERITGDTTGSLVIHKKERYKLLGEFEVLHADYAQAYIVKVYKYPRLFQKIKYLFKHTRAFNEFNNTYIAARKGIPADAPVAYGERKRLFNKESYIIIEKIRHARTLKEFFVSVNARRERTNVLEIFGRLAKNMHDAGVKQDDFSLNNFLLYNDKTEERKIILIDFERVSIQTGCLGERQRVWYLAKLNRHKKYVTNTDRLRFLLSYTGSDHDYCKKLARQIEALTVRIQKKDAGKFRRQCVQENRKFGILRENKFYGYYRKNYSKETLLTLLNNDGEVKPCAFHTNRFQTLRFTRHATVALCYGSIIRTWRHANALFALRINVPVPVGVFKRNLRKPLEEGFIILDMPDNCISMNQYIAAYSDADKSPLMNALSRLVEQVSPFGIFCEDLNTCDILVQTNENHKITCYLGNYASFYINRRSFRKNRQTNTHVVNRLLHIN